MPFDTGIPSGTKPLNLVDDDHRSNNAALQEALNREHDFNDTSGTQTGRHKFTIDTAILIEAESTDNYVNGSIAFVNNADAIYGPDDQYPFDHVNAKHAMAYMDGEDGGGTAGEGTGARTAKNWRYLYPVYSDEPVFRTRAEWGSYTTLSVHPTTGQIAWNWDDNNAFKVTLLTVSGPSTVNTIMVPTGHWADGTGRFGTWVLEVTQPAAVHSLAFDVTGPTFYAGLGGNMISIAPIASSRSVIYFTLLSDGKINVQALPDVSAIV